MFAETITRSSSERVVAAIAEDRIGYALQPVVSIARPTSELYQECLVRLVDETGTVRSPLHFVPQLEACGDIGLLDEHMIRLALEALETSPAATLGCNISVETMQSASSWSRIRQNIVSRPELASRLIIEITETCPVADMDNLLVNIAEARAMGCRIAIDDFGAGFFSPSLLLRFEVDIVKVDASMLWTIRKRSKNATTLRHIIGFAACIAPIVVLEGVEREEHLQLACDAGATHAQGYLIARPVIPRSPGGKNGQRSSAEAATEMRCRNRGGVH
jgi:EAL domain-containing protein (putative c-di-GMP-specific phosphodiesterase class I)